MLEPNQINLYQHLLKQQQQLQQQQLQQQQQQLLLLLLLLLPIIPQCPTVKKHKNSQQCRITELITVIKTFSRTVLDSLFVDP
jgi:hypothetical protein